VSKTESSENNVMLDPPRCGICGTKVTLYPLGWVACPHCGKPVCRQCWGSSWVAKNFDAEKCGHSDGSRGPAVMPIGEKLKGPAINWPSGLVTFALVCLVILILYLLWDLLAY
jgi:predicted RNA-binding Zn-ribbon protein involved in translation (DUF1610 family)